MAARTSAMMMMLLKMHPRRLSKKTQLWSRVRGGCLSQARRSDVALSWWLCPDKTLLEQLRSCRAFTRPVAEAGTFHLFLYNSKADGECKTQPTVRLPVLRSGYLARVSHASLRARSGGDVSSEDPEAKLAEDDLYLFMDAFKHDNKNAFINACTSADKP